MRKSYGPKRNTMLIATRIPKGFRSRRARAAVQRGACDFKATRTQPAQAIEIAHVNAIRQGAEGIRAIDEDQQQASQYDA